MDELRPDVRRAFTNEQAELGNLADAPERLVRGALAAPDVRGASRTQWAAGIAAIVIAALVIGTFAYIRSGGGIRPVTSPVVSPSPHPQGSPSPSVRKAPSLAVGTVIIDADLVNVATNWVLLTNCVQPMTGRCAYSVEATTNGGQTWSKAVQAGPSFDPTDGDAPRHIRFLNAKDGFVYGGAAAFVTHNGGRSWSTVGIRATFFAFFEGRGQMAWAATYPCAKGVLCSYEVRSSKDAGRTWSDPHQLPVGSSPADAIPFADTGLLVPSDPTGDMELTLNGGATWTVVKNPCTGNVFRSVAATSDGNELWQMCFDFPKNDVSIKKLFVSEDGGGSWSLLEAGQVSGQQASPGLLMLISPALHTALMATPLFTAAVTHDSGLTWIEVFPRGTLFQLVRFANAEDGLALDVSRNIWTTSDGGDHWTQ